jgi:hypothetical protein
MVRTRLRALGATVAVAMVAALLAVASPAHAQTPEPPKLTSCKAWVQSYGHSNSTTVYATFIVKCPYAVVGSIWVAGTMSRSGAQSEPHNVCSGDATHPVSQCVTTGHLSDPAGSQRYEFGFDTEYTKVAYVAISGKAGSGGATLWCYPTLNCYHVVAYL